MIFTVVDSFSPNDSGAFQQTHQQLFVKDFVSVFPFNAAVPTFFKTLFTSNAKTEATQRAVNKRFFHYINDSF